MQQKQKAKICFVIYIAGNRFFFIYDVIVKQFFINGPLITTDVWDFDTVDLHNLLQFGRPLKNL